MAECEKKGTNKQKSTNELMNKGMNFLVVQICTDDSAVVGGRGGAVPHTTQQLHQLCHLLLHWLKGQYKPLLILLR
jgi:hypothetical protein